MSPRIRYIKPGFFTDDDLAECSHLARLVFAGLWTIADREGRLEDRPRRIRAELLAYEEAVDMDALLQELADHGALIVRYEVDGRRYIAIPGWPRHQKPHSRELPSTIPEPTEHDLGSAQARPRQCPGTEQAGPSTTQAMPSPASRAHVMGNGDLDLDGDGDGDGDGVNTLSDENESDVRNRESNNSFTDFWSTYPRRVGMTAAKRSWKRLGVADRRAATLAARHFAEYVRQTATELRFVPHPATFIGPKRSWEDWTDGPPPGYSGGNGRGSAPAQNSYQGERTAADREFFTNVPEAEEVTP